MFSRSFPLVPSVLPVIDGRDIVAAKGANEPVKETVTGAANTFADGDPPVPKP